MRKELLPVMKSVAQRPEPTPNTPPGNSRRKPNIVLIMTDQHRADMMSCAGPSPVPTPRMDQIAADGVRFSNAFCPYPVCLASRGSLLTGLYPHHTGAINNTDRLEWRLRTMAHHFAEAGYLTGLVGKMHFNDAHNHGFEYYLSINDWLMFLGTMGFFCFNMMLFMKFLPMISLFEVRELIHKKNLAHHH